MLKKATLAFLFSSIFSLQATELPFLEELYPIQPLSMPNFLDLNNVIQKSYNQTIDNFSQFSKFLPKEPICDELTQIQYIILINTIYKFSHRSMITVIFYDNIQTVEPIKKAFEKIKNGYLIAIDIHKKNQAIKNVFNITKPTIIYYYEFKEIARSTNFDCNNVVQYSKNNPFLPDMEIPRCADLKSFLRKSYNEWIRIFSTNHWRIANFFNYRITKFLPKEPITQELTQARFLAFLGAIQCHSTPGIAVVIFYDNSQKIESFKKLAEQNNTCLIVADINKTEQEIKNILNITEPTIIYYHEAEELARSTNFDTKDILRHINYHLEAKNDIKNQETVQRMKNFAKELSKDVELPRFINVSNAAQEEYNQMIIKLSQHPVWVKFVPKKTITHELTQIHFIKFVEAVLSKNTSDQGVTAVVFYNNTHQIESLKKYFEIASNGYHDRGYLIAADIHTTEQEIKNIFNITKPTIIYYKNSGEEIARSINFDINNILQYIKNNTPLEPDLYPFKKSRFSDLKNLIQKSFDLALSIFESYIMHNEYAVLCSMFLIPQKPITNELAQYHFLNFSKLFFYSWCLEDITVVAFYNNGQKIESLKNLFEQQKSAYLIAADINKTEQEIKSIFNITTEPIIIYYKKNCEEIARSSNFDPQEVLRYITTI